MKKGVFSYLALALILSMLHLSAPQEVRAEEKVKKPYTVTLQSKDGKVVGEAKLVETNNGVVIQVIAEGFDPGFHGIHFHETGKCEGPDFISAGEHFNPFKKEHGLKNPKGPHAGDLRNVNADAQGKINTTFITPRVTLMKGKENSLRDLDGSALVIHQNVDDQMTNPSGNSGARIVCGVIK
ncbi:superoxide dismutase [Cu-Zn] 1 [Pullulanibacillus camelliae]|uniref:Superoxide dismutase [Cu-Zn] n=1 Tax=Pullulanibacillus camelliae TaxID=1707096 RepID=A0A8J2YKU2_9BACL|nr:superoxide dismutase family protein [Pullulanibacillus camelliae]GGE50045.1 superoxide dismutase [Cu-Zn] 1 [Pullulanibacillus camelliae]